MSEWTEEDIETMFRLLEKGMSMAQVAAYLPGKSRNAVIGKFHREGARRGFRLPARPARKPILETIGDPNRISPQLLRNTTPKRVCEPRRPMPKVAKVGVGFLLPSLPEPSRSSAVGILDVTGCRWPVGEDASVPGRHTFCNHETDGSAYCAYHHEVYLAKPVPKSEVKRFRVPTAILLAGVA